MGDIASDKILEKFTCTNVQKELLHYSRHRFRHCKVLTGMLFSKRTGLLTFAAQILTTSGYAITVVNPIAPRKAKIAYNFGLSECNRVKLEIYE